MSNECENDQHEQCDGDECACPCHTEIEKATRAMSDLLERSTGAITVQPIPPDHGDHGASNWNADRRLRSFYAPSSEAADLYHPTAPEYDEEAAAREQAEQLGMGLISRVIDATRRQLNGQPVKKGKPAGRCSKGGHPVEINALSTVDQIGYRRDGVCPDCRAGVGSIRLRWPFRLFGRRSR